MDRDVALRTWWVALAIALMTASFLLVKTARDALYFLDSSLAQLPWIYLGIALMAGPTAMVVLGLMKQLGPRRVRLLLPALTTVILVVYHPFAQAGAGLAPSIFFAFVPLVWGVMFSTAWLLGADLLEGCPRDILARAYSRVGAASIAGAVGGGALARLVSNLCRPEDLLLFGAAFLAASAGVMAFSHNRHPMGGSTTEASTIGPDAPLPPLRVMLGDGYARIMLTLAVLGGLVGILIEYQFYHAAAHFGSSGQQNVRFFANVYTLLSAMAFVLQFWVTPRLQKRAGVAGSLVVLPAGVLLVACVIVVGGASLISRSALRLAEGGLKSSVYRSNWEQAYLGLPRDRRSTTKVVVDGMGSRIGEATAALFLLAWMLVIVDDAPIESQSMSWVTWALIGGSVIWVAATVGLGRHRDTASAITELDDEARSVPLPDT